jgi:hypothetical protein
LKFYIEKLGPAPSVHQVAASDKGELSLPITWKPKFLLRENTGFHHGADRRARFLRGRHPGCCPAGLDRCKVSIDFPMFKLPSICHYLVD